VKFGPSGSVLELFRVKHPASEVPSMAQYSMTDEGVPERPILSELPQMIVFIILASGEFSR